MSTNLSVCETCGAALDPSAPGGLCRRCLLARAMQPTEPSVAAAPQSPPSLDAVQAAFPQLAILDFVGQGGMGWVFKASQPKLDRLVALKLLPSSLAERDAAFAGRFEREGKLLARLHHPNIVAVHDSGAAGGFFYLLMEYVQGVNLRQAMRSNRFTPAQALSVVPHICDALQYAHDEGVLHRDIKPENILLDARGRVKLADFGIAKLIGSHGDPRPGAAAATDPGLNLTQSGTTLGTPSYMAPEQRDSPGDVDNRADIYSLGVVFYEMLTGELPAGVFAPPSAISATDPRVDAIVRQALEKERTLRQSSADQVKTQVETISRAKTPPSSPVVVLRWRDRWLWDSSYVILFLLAPAIFAVIAVAILLPIFGVRALYGMLLEAPGLLFAAIYGWVGYRVRRLKAALPDSPGEVAEALIFRRPFQSPGLAVLHPDRLDLFRVVGEPIIIPIADISSMSEVRMFNGQSLNWKRGFELNLKNGQRVGVALPVPFWMSWRAALSRGGLADLSISEAAGPGEPRHLAAGGQPAGSNLVSSQKWHAVRPRLNSESTAMNSSTKDKIAGSAKESAGKIKEETGKAIGNPDLQTRGATEKAAGKIEKKVGDVKKVFGK